MRRSRTILNANAHTSRVFQLGVIVLLVVCALVFQWLGRNVIGQVDVSQAELVNRLHAQGIKTTVMGPTTAPLAIRGTRLRLNGGAVTQPAEIFVYEDVDGAVRIDNNIITSRVRSDDNLWVGRGEPITRATPDVQVIDVSSWHLPFYVFQQGDLLVVYIGNDPEVPEVLATVAGRQVAFSGEG